MTESENQVVNYQNHNIYLACLSDEEFEYIVDVVRKGDLEPLHKHNAKGVESGVFDDNICEYIKYTEKLFFYGGMPYLYENGTYHQDVGGTKVKSLIKSLILPEFINIKTIDRVYELLKIDADIQRSFEDLNRQPLHTIAFTNGLLDVLDGKLYSYSEIDAEDLYIINQLPHKYPTSEPPHDRIDKWLDFICLDPDDKEMLLQYAGLCMTHDTRQQKFLMLKGKGGQGKSIVINMINAVVGEENLSHLALETISGNKFMAWTLLGKLVNSCGDLRNKPLEDITVIKKLVGEDPIDAEIKYAIAPVSFLNYAKLLFSANEIPLIKNERTDGFYRRLLVLEMPNTPPEINPNLTSELKEQLDGFIWLAVQALQRMYGRDGNGKIIISKNSKTQTEKHKYFSDSVSGFIHEMLNEDESGRVSTTDMWKMYQHYCEEEECQGLGKKSFFKALEDKGYPRPDERFFLGLSKKPADWKKADGTEPFTK